MSIDESGLLNDQLRSMRLIGYGFLVATAMSSNLRAQTWRDSLDLMFDDGQGNTMPYRLFVPPDHDQPDMELPLVVYLHRAAHVGTDNKVHVQSHIAGLIQATQGPDFTAYLLAPQAPTAWWYEAVHPITMQVLEEVEQTYNVDSDRIYLTGTSLGGFGITDLVSRHPGRFAAAIPLSAGVLTADRVPFALESDPLLKADVLAETPLWAFHATEDTTNDVEWSRELVAMIEEAGGSPRYTELLGGADHSSIWSGIYLDRTNELYPWIFEQSLAVPEPMSVLLLLTGLMGVAVYRCRFRS